MSVQGGLTQTFVRRKSCVIFIDPTCLLSRNCVGCLSSSLAVLSEKPSIVEKPNKQANWPIIDNPFSNQIDISYQTHHIFLIRVTATRIS